MSANQWSPLQGCLQDATERQTAYALSVIHLFKSSLIPTGTTPLADFVAAEADYDTYVALTLTAWNDPILAPGSGYMIGSPLVQFETGVVDPVVGNVIGGWWIEDAAGKLRLAGTFDSPIPMQLAGQGIPINVIVIFPTNFA